MRSYQLIQIFFAVAFAASFAAVAKDADAPKLKALVPKMAPAKISKPLIGRLEQIAKADALLPLALTKTSELKAAASKNATSKPPETSPEEFLGRWGGTVKISQRLMPIPDPTESRFDQNETGQLILDVVNNKLSTIIKPAIVFFPGGHATNKENLLIRRSGHYGPIATAQLQLLALLRPDERVDFAFRYLPTGFCRTENLSGDKWNDAIKTITLSMLSKQTFEQDVVVERIKNGKLYGYTESVIRLTLASKDVVQVNIARAEYTPERKLKILTVLDGNLDKKWEATAASVTKLTHQDWQKAVDTLGGN